MRQQLFRSSHGDRLFVPNFAVVVTDGIGNMNADSTVLQAGNAKIDGTHIILITVGTSYLTIRRQLIDRSPPSAQSTLADSIGIIFYRLSVPYEFTLVYMYGYM